MKRDITWVVYDLSPSSFARIHGEGEIPCEEATEDDIEIHASSPSVIHETQHDHEMQAPFADTQADTETWDLDHPHDGLWLRIAGHGWCNVLFTKIWAPIFDWDFVTNTWRPTRWLYVRPFYP